MDTCHVSDVIHGNDVIRSKSINSKSTEGTLATAAANYTAIHAVSSLTDTLWKTSHCLSAIVEFAECFDCNVTHKWHITRTVQCTLLTRLL